MERAKKEKVVAELGSKLKKMSSMFIAEYSGLNVAQMTKIRKELRGVDAEFTVVKNTLLSIASEGTRAQALKERFTGPNAIVGVYKDPVSAARIISGFMKEMPQLKIKGGFLGDQIIGPEDVNKLATLPSKEVLIGKFVGLLKGVPQRLVFVLSGNMGKLLMTLNAIKAQKEQG
ncbi:MAG: 50S ribosomal protein L10 [Syntrophorhabdaceae bacterium]|nr:50S ribosomal protein L10 [Syntrophorhabdaceae bacterium]